MDNLALLKQSDVLAKTVDWMVSIDILNHYLVKKQLLSKYLIGFLISHLITIHSGNFRVPFHVRFKWSRMDFICMFSRNQRLDTIFFIIASDSWQKTLWPCLFSIFIITHGFLKMEEHLTFKHRYFADFDTEEKNG